ncbi:2,3-bisphosphoglycerate-independent phosphoglycerate mutase [bacterium]|nr:2,3-bisphosphoglycerate-independent phosphoglycerate mutase [bacterium]
MDREELIQEVSQHTDSKIVLLVMDGLGDLPTTGQTPLEAAPTPHMDELASKGACGLTDPVFRGITPGSGPAHLALFGYDPLKYILGRGILEALGIGVDVEKDEMVARGNFATLKDDLVVDRRAGRIPTSENKKLCEKLNHSLMEIEGTSIQFYPGKEHRFVVKFSKPGLVDALSDADPQKENNPRVYTQPLSSQAKETARMVNTFMDKVTEVLKNSSPTNTILLRGFSKHPSIPTMAQLYKVKPAAIANYPMYKGLAKLVGMNILPVGQEISDLFDCLEQHYDQYNFFYIHVKKTDSWGEDGNFPNKKEVIEKTDRYIPRVRDLNPQVLTLTSDHSTPCLLKSHSWHPNPFLLYSSTAQPDRSTHFTEKECSRGYLGRFPAVNAMTLMLAHANKLKKFGA